ncbi:PREDICTED: protein phosphatase Slingshot homolog 2 isoform X2 [Nanorana parkeri]|uniref:protein phosphatase Slingshot homolog 2 isoform X2 n=1 Tax=Nanorana parkeri TaxID=125878 RepID=UPI000854AA5E|nr:PREDICTED: protein phosphatase Slingshot homolog 2 isoform X2 [Nanorana parkeri]
MCRCGWDTGRIPMTLSRLSGDRQAGHLCGCCGVKMIPHFSENAVISQNTINQLISESFLTVKGAALFLPRGNGSSTPRISHRRNKHAGDLQQHLQAMFTLLRPEDNIRLAVKLESTYQNRTRYMVVVSTNGRQDTEESIVLGIDFACNDSSSCTMGLVLPLWSDTLIHLDGDGGFSVSTDNRVHVFKPVSVQAMWSALQSLHKACEVARANNYYPGSLFLTWVSYYESHVNSDQTSVNEWNAMQDLQSRRSDSPVLFTDVPTERERTELLIKIKLREIMMQKDLENITSKEIRTELEMQMVCNLREFKEFIDNEMIVILGQMDSPTEIFDHVYLGSEWNASNLEDLQNRGVRYILNVTREIDNFFPGVFEYHNIRVYDEEGTDLLAYWNDAYKFISKAKKHGAKCLVHCKMGVSRSASTVIAYAMKEYGWNLDRAFDYVKERRTVTKPNPSFMKQLEEYQGILLASKQRHNKLWRSHSDSDLSDHHESIGKTGMDLSKKDITSSAEQLSDIHHSFTLGPQMENCNPNCPNSNSLCNTTQSHFEFTSCDFHTGQIEDILNLNTMNGCLARCCLDKSSVFLDNCRPERLSGDVSSHSESFTDRSAELQDFMLEDMEKDALKNDVNLLPMRELESQPGEPPESPYQPSFTSQSEDMSADRIDFLSALEKFVELSQENRPRTCSTTRAEEQLSNVRNGGLKGSWPENVISESPVDKLRVSPDIGTPQVSEDSSTDEEQPKEISEQKDHLSKSHSENGISVKEIVTEIESFNQGVGQCQQKTDNLSSQVQAPKRNTIHDLSLEAVCEPENGSKSPGCEGGTAPLQDKPNDPKCQEGKQSSEEDSENSNETNDQQDLCGQAPKLCVGSVRRATMEFEERLRQEQEQQHITAVVVRKNSKNDAAVCDAPTKCRLEDSSLDILDHERDTRVRLKITGFEAAESPRSEPSTDSQSSLLFEPLSEQEKQDTSHIGLAVKPEGAGNELQSPTTAEILERTNESEHFPKRIELDDGIEIKLYDSNDNISLQDSVIYTGEVAVDSECHHLPLEAPLRNVCASTSDSSAHIENLPLLNSPKSGSPNLSFPVDSPKEELSVIELKDPSDFSSTNYLCHPCSIVLEGATEECTSTDEDFGNLSNCTDKYSSDFFLGESELMEREADSALSQLSPEDLNLINKLTENIRELHEVLDVSALSFGLPHSSSSDSIKDSGNSPGVVKQRAKEIEARIRQAGLTTPSQMKRSASLAKLGCLELSKDDLSERESVSSDNNLTYPDLLQSSLRIVPGNYESDLDSKSEDPPGKLCILSVQASTGVEPTQHFVEQIKTAECIVKSKPVEKPLVQYAKEFGTTQQGLLPGSESELTVSQEHLHRLVELEPPVPLLTITPRHEHGRTHPLRRLKKTNEKKRTTNPLYNTM